MRRLLVLVAVVFGVCSAFYGAFVSAQDATPGAGMAGTPCPAGMASPVASPMATPEATANEAAIGSPAASPTGVGCAVEIRDFAFQPAQIEIAVGTTVTWTNNDTVPHTSTATDGTWDSGNLDQRQSYSHTFDEAGTHDYVCLYHPNMRGTVVVR